MRQVQTHHRPRLLAAVGLLATAFSHYTVAPGDTLSAIATRHGTTVAQIVADNGLADPNAIRAGQSLDVPGAHDAPAPTGTAGGTGSAPGAGRPETGRMIARVANQYGWSAAFVKAVAWQESGWNNAIVSSAGAVGIMQVLPSTGRVASDLLGRTLDLDDPEDNVTAGVVFLDHLWDLTGRNTRMTLAGYFQGLASVRRNGVYEATRRYTDNVLALRERFR